jgi:hypothetical protein
MTPLLPWQQLLVYKKKGNSHPWPPTLLIGIRLNLSLKNDVKKKADLLK